MISVNQGIDNSGGGGGTCFLSGGPLNGGGGGNTMEDSMNFVSQVYLEPKIYVNKNPS